MSLKLPLIKISGDEGLGFYKGNYIYDSDLYTAWIL